MKLRFSFFLPFGFLLFAVFVIKAPAEDYDPLALSENGEVTIKDMSVENPARSREIPIRLYLPETGEPQPVVMFSHGLGGSRAGCSYLGKHWAGRGYVAVFLQHPGSDHMVWKNQPLSGRMRAMEKAASGRNFLLRVRDVPAVIDALEKWNTEEGHWLAKRLDLDQLGMSGHSFGAVTTQAVSGQATGFGRSAGRRFTDDRIDAAIAFSPSTPRRGGAATAFGSVTIPWMLMTGTRDFAPIGGADLSSRMGVYPNLPETIDKYELVLQDAEHSAFSDRSLHGDQIERNPNHHRAVLALSTAFWDTYLRDNPEAKEWLQGDGPRSVLEKEDRWQMEKAR